MQLEIFTLCDAATEHAGKLNIIGTFDALRAQSIERPNDIQLARVLRGRVAKRENFQLHEGPPRGLTSHVISTASLAGSAFRANAAGAGAHDFVAAAMRD